MTFRLLFILFGIMLCQGAEAGVWDDLEREFRFSVYGPRAAAIANELFYALFLLNFIIFVTLQVKSSSWVELFFGLGWFIVIRLMYLAMIEHPEWWTLIITSWTDSASYVSGFTDISPTKIFAQAVDIPSLMVQKEKDLSGVLSPSFVLVFVLAIIVLAVLSIFGGVYAFTLFHSYRLASEGVILLGFGGASFTADVAIAFIRGVIGLGFNLFMLITLTGFMLTYMQTLINSINGQWCLPVVGCLYGAPMEIYMALAATAITFAILGHMALRWNHFGGGAAAMSALGGSTLLGKVAFGVATGGVGGIAGALLRAAKVNRQSHLRQRSGGGGHSAPQQVSGSSSPGVIPGRSQ